MNRRLKVVITLVASFYLVITFFRSFGVPQPKFQTEFDTSSLLQTRDNEVNSNWKDIGLNFHPSKVKKLPSLATLRQQLSYQFPYEPKKGFQKSIWQTWKVGLDDESFPQNYKSFIKTWDEKNPNYKHHVISDDQCEELIKQLFQTVPDVARAYDIMPKSILKADFFRYLILFARGGVYSDIDTVSLKPIDTWLSKNATLYGKVNHAGIAVGIEADPDRPDWADWYAKRIQFCQWTIQSKKGHPLLRELIARITEHTLERSRKGQLKKVLGKDEGGDIMNWTGPGIFTDTVFDYMNNILQPAANFDTRKYDEIVTWKTFTGMEMPIGVDDVLILPITSFSPNVGHMGSKSSRDPMAYVDHRFLGTWKDESPSNN